MVVAAGILFLVMVVSFLIYIIASVASTIDVDSEYEAIIKDFFRYFRKIDSRSDNITLTFKQLLAFYNVSPSSWGEHAYYNLWFTYKNNGEEFTIKFKTYGDQMKYRLWKRNKKKRDAMLQKARETNKFIESVRQQSIRAEQEAMEEARQLHERISNELEKGEDNVSMGRIK